MAPVHVLISLLDFPCLFLVTELFAIAQTLDRDPDTLGAISTADTGKETGS